MNMKWRKFRAWHKKEQRMISDVGWRYTDCGIMILPPLGMAFIGTTAEEEQYIHGYYFDEIYLMQFTGLTDRNKVDVYEGDICGYAEDPSRFEVVFEKCAFRKKYRKWDATIERPIISQWDIDHIGMHVIGNIHDNPNLLK